MMLLPLVMVIAPVATARPGMAQAVAPLLASVSAREEQTLEEKAGVVLLGVGGDVEDWSF